MNACTGDADRSGQARRPHRGQDPRPLNENATRNSSPQRCTEIGGSRGQTAAPKTVAELVLDKPLEACAVLQRRGMPPGRLEMEASTDVCLAGTHWHRLVCAHQCAQTRS
jgi:hypothetical protein